MQARPVGFSVPNRRSSGLKAPNRWMCASSAAGRDATAGSAWSGRFVWAVLDGLLFLPYLQGERVPNLPHATGSLLGLRPGLLEPARLFRAAMEGTTHSLCWGLERMQKLGIGVDAVRLVGGGARSPLWCQIVADALQVPVTVLSEPDSAALGAALHAWWTAERRENPGADLESLTTPFVAAEAPIRPDPSRAAVYDEARRRLIETTRKLWME